MALLGHYESTLYIYICARLKHIIDPSLFFIIFFFAIHHSEQLFIIPLSLGEGLIKHHNDELFQASCPARKIFRETSMNDSVHKNQCEETSEL